MSEVNISSVKKRIMDRFSSSTGNYEQEAVVQRSAAKRLGSALEPWKLTLPPGPLLELGAGTGFFTRELMRIVPERPLEVTDLTEEMLETCRLANGERVAATVSYRTLDAEAWEPPDRRYALIAGNFVAQWFHDPAFTLGRLVRGLMPGGLLLMSFPGDGSFPEWREQCGKLDLPFTANPMPNPEEVVFRLSSGPVQVDVYEDTEVMHFQSPADFFHHIKRIGASASMSGRQLTQSQLRRLVQLWDQTATRPVTITWHLVFLALKRDYE